MNRGKVSTQVFLCFLMMMFLMVIGCSSAENSILNPLNIHSISGTVNGVGSSVLITLNGASSATTQTDATTGFYKFDSLKGGDYTVTPSLAGHTFNPISTGVSLNGTNINATDINFSATASSGLTYSISGAVSGAILAGVTITLTGDISMPATTKTDANGNYSFPGLVLNGNYTVTPSIDGGGYTFSPISTGVIISGADETGINFTAKANTATTYSILGKVTGTTIAGVKITLSGGTFGTTITTTDASGNYSFAGLLAGSYTVTPSLAGYTFSPANRFPTLSTADSTGNDFTSTNVSANYSISGTVTGASGVTINLTGAATASTTGGSFNFTGLANGTYTVTPVSTAYTFLPASSTVTVAGGNITGMTFTATANTASKYSISGTVSGQVVSGVTITLGGAGSGTTTTNSSGNYSFSGLVAGGYTVTPTAGMGSYTSVPHSLSPTISSSNVTGQNFVVGTTTTTTTQADLVGTWAIQDLRTGSTPKTMYGTFTVDSSGNLTCLTFADSGGATSCPSGFAMQWTVDSSGVITESGASAGSNTNMTMTSNKKLIAGTGGSMGGSSADVRIIQKVVSGTTYSSADITNKSFVVHELDTSTTGEPSWEYGAGTVDASGAVSFTSMIANSGPQTPSSPGTMSIDGSGNVTISGSPTFHGFLSDDKKTIVATNSHTNSHGNNYSNMIIIQITGKTYTAGPLPAGVSIQHFVGEVDFTNSPDFESPANPYSFWVAETQTVTSGGVYTLSNATSSLSGFTPSSEGTASITSSGVITTTANSTYNGQISHDGTFSVGTMTVVDNDSNHWYILSIHTR